MSKFKFINLLDNLFIYISIFLISFAWIQFFAKSFILSLLLSAILAITIILLIRFFKNKNNLNHQISLNRQHNFEIFKLAIQTMPTSKLAMTIKKLIPPKYMAKVYKGDIIFSKNNSSHIFTFYYAGNLDEYKLLEIIKTKSQQNITIFCPSHPNELKSIIKAFKHKNINLISLEQLFDLFNDKQIKINTSHIDLSKHKITLKEILKNSISQSKSKGYFISGLVLLFTSIVIPYRIYYVIFSSILFILSLLCRIKPISKSNIDIFN